MKIDIVDIGFGNIKSIKNWIEKTHYRPNIITKSQSLKSDLLILPGVISKRPLLTLVVSATPAVMTAEYS